MLRVFSSLRPLIRMIKEVIKELGSFTILLFISLFFFSVITFRMFQANEENQGTAKEDRVKYYTIAADQINLLAGGQYDQMINSTTHFIVYTTAFYFCVVLMLNLLIGIIGERFGIVLEQTVPMDCVERTNLMIEIEGFAKLLRYLLPTKSTQEQLVYIHYARYV